MSITPIKTMLRVHSRGSVTVLLAFLASCGGTESPTETDGTPTPIATSLTLSATTLSFSALGATEQLSATVLDQSGAAMSGVSVGWSSSNSGVASVSATGRVTAVAEGKADIRAVVASLEVTAEATVLIPGPFAFVLNKGGDVSVIDLVSNSVIGASIPVGDQPLGMAITPDGTRVYVTNAGSDNVSVIDVATRTTIGAPIPVGDGPREIAITPDGTRAYIANSGDDNVAILDLATNSVVGTIPVLDFPVGMAITPDGTLAYVTSFLDWVGVIDLVTGSLIKTLDVQAGKIHGGLGWPAASVTPDGTSLYVTSGPNNTTVGVIDVATNSALAPVIPLGEYSNGVAITPDGASAYVVIGVANDTLPGNTGWVMVIDTATGTVSGVLIVVGQTAHGIAITSDGERAYVTNRGDSSVSVIDVASNSVIGAPIRVGLAPVAIVFAPVLP